ncbi:hypothetical protein V495_03421 [Pseudogymnoascus sp. VKM F-4514 (FW-929)]|nr:hypothetical protein V495_03421 [Pseudogymnoascus sp. VKM F-4514 (FW-929)]KFY58901.1 hypothetical protein V497_04617 [Pseudogymnoascus sp. VKM F-4516 (FW-969)]
MSTLSTFHLFPALPVEIRLKIWSLLLSISRDVICTRNIVTTAALNKTKAWGTNTPSPALLHVNRESRYEALGVYTPYFATASNPRPIYLSLSQDVVRFADSLLSHIPYAVLHEIQHMVTDTKDYAYFGYYHMDTLKSMKKLRELEIYAEKDAVYGTDAAERYINLLVSEFEDAMEDDPGWECPKIKIFDAQTGKELRFIEGGAKIPGWVHEIIFYDDDDI